MSDTKFYLHLIDGRPGYFSARDEQIVLMEDSSRWKDEIGAQALRNSTTQILRDQQVTRRNREKWGFKNDGPTKYGYAIITVHRGSVKRPKRIRVPA